MYKLIIFDFDNTLYVGRRFALRLIWANLRRIMWVKAERKARKALAGKDFGSGEELHAAMFKTMAETTGAAEERIAAWYTKQYLPSMVEILRKHYPARSEAKELFENLQKQNCAVAVLSDYPMTRERLQAIGLGDSNVQTFSSEEMGALKPSQRPFCLVAEKMSVAPKDVLVIGDRADTDGLGAQNAGMNCLLIEGKRATKECGMPIAEWQDIVKKLSV